MSLNTGFKPIITMDWSVLGCYITATQYTNDINPIRSSQLNKVQHCICRVSATLDIGPCCCWADEQSIDPDSPGPKHTDISMNLGKEQNYFDMNKYASMSNCGFFFVTSFYKVIISHHHPNQKMFSFPKILTNTQQSEEFRHLHLTWSWQARAVCPLRSNKNKPTWHAVTFVEPSVASIVWSHRFRPLVCTGE